MLSKLTAVTMLRRFSTTIAPVSRSAVKNSLIDNHGENKGNVVPLDNSTELQQIIEVEKQHLNYVVNGYDAPYSG
jgi:hypothetical protein